MIRPVEYLVSAHNGRVTSPFGNRRDPMGSGRIVMHWGTDAVMNPRSGIWTTPVAGEVVHLGTHGSRGKVVVVRAQGTDTLHLFQHLDSYLCQRGDWLNVGDPVGVDGRTGAATGRHLHYEIRIDDGTNLGRPVWGDPEEFRWEGAGLRKTYVVKRGDTLAQIARKFAVTVEDLREWNNRTPAEDTRLAIGTVLFVEPDWRVLADDLKFQNKALKAKVAEQENVITGQSVELETLKDTVSAQSQLIDDLREELKKSVGDDGLIAELKETAEAQAATIAGLTQELKELSEEVSDLNRNRKALASENEQLKANLGDLREKYKRTLVLDISWAQLLELATELLKKAAQKLFGGKV